MITSLKRTGYAALGVLATALPTSVLAQDAIGVNDIGENVNLGTAGLRKFVFNIINVFLGFLGVIAIVMFLYGGFIWMTAAGNEEKVDKARKLIISAIIGAAIVLGALALTNFVLSSLLNATTN